MSPLEVYTLGHSNHPFDGVLALLKSYQIDILLDIRRFPHQNFFPEFSRRRMKMRLARENIIYIFMGDLLGPSPKDPGLVTCLGEVDYARVEQSEPFQKGLAWVLEECRNSRVCLFCGESDPLVCHRHHLVGQNLMARGVRVRHIRLTGQVEDAEPDLFHREML